MVTKQAFEILEGSCWGLKLCFLWKFRWEKNFANTEFVRLCFKSYCISFSYRVGFSG